MGGGGKGGTLAPLPGASRARRTYTAPRHHGNAAAPSDNCHHSLILTSFLLNILPRAFKLFTNCN